MNGPELTVGKGVIAELIRAAAFESPVSRASGMAVRGGALLVGSAVRVRVVDDRVIVRLRIVARPGHALGPLTARSGPRWPPRSSACSASTWGR